MLRSNRDSTTMRLAVVTGANKGIGFEICRQLATVGVTVVLTSRDEKRGVEAVEKLRGSGLSNLIFHQLDVTNPPSFASLADFIQTQFGKLDILVKCGAPVNNAGLNGIRLDDDAYRDLMAVDDPLEVRMTKYIKIITETSVAHEVAEACIKANYYGTKRVTEALLPILQLSDSPRIVNVSSSLGKLQNVTDTWAREVLSNEDGLTEERVDDVLNKFLKELKGKQGWSAYIMSKAAMNAHTRILAKKFPRFRINSVCPGCVQTDINHQCCSIFTIEQGAEGPVKMALFPDDGPSGLFFFQKEVSTF